MKIFGLQISLAKKPAKQKAVALPSSSGGQGGKRVTGAIRKQPKREVSFQIADIKRAIQQAQNPDMPDRKLLHEIYEYILRDGRLKSQLRTARIKVKSEPWLLYRNNTPDLTISELYRKIWMGKIIEAIVDCEFYGYSLIEFEPIDPSQAIANVTVIDRQYVSPEQQWVLLEGTYNGPYLPYSENMWALNLVEFGRKDDYGTLLEASYNVIWKFYSRSDWSRASEKVGMPILNVTANTNDDKELDDLETRAANFGSDGYIVTQAGDTVAMIERKSDRLHDIFLDNVKLCNEEVGHIINGQTATSDTKSFVGSAEVQERTMEDYTTDRLQKIADEINDRLFPFLATKGFAVEGLIFDYPELVRTRQRRMTGQPLPTDPVAPNGSADDNEEEDKSNPPSGGKGAKPAKVPTVPKVPKKGGK